MPYPNGPLKTRAVVKPGIYAVIPPEGRVFNVIPNIEGCQTTILCTPKIGASFVQYIGTAQPGGGTKVPFGAEKNIEAFIYFLDGDGKLELQVGDKKQTFGQGGYAFSPPGVGISFKNVGDKPLRFLLYKQVYIDEYGQFGGQPFASVITGSLLQGDALPIAIDRAVQFVTLGIRATFGHDIPTRNGILLERVLHTLNVPMTTSTYTLLQEE